MTAFEQWMAVTDVQRNMWDAFRDSEGQPVRVGSIVHYVPRDDAPDPDDGSPFINVWTEDRWGIVTGLARRTYANDEGFDVSVRVTNINVTNDDGRSRWIDGEWFCGPERLKVMA